MFIGRFSPFHNGHLEIMKKKINEGKPLLVMVRDTHYDDYSANVRKEMIEASLSRLNADAKVIVIDDIESVNYGRGVGYEVNEVQVPDHVKAISATDLRKRIRSGDSSWKEFVPVGADSILEGHHSKQGVVVWFTGLPSSGKTTIARAVMESLSVSGVKSEHLDGDAFRQKVTGHLGFSKDDRKKNLFYAAGIAKELSKNRSVVLSSFITPYQDARDMIRKELEPHARFLEVYVKTSLEECRKRDVKGLYAKSDRGEVKNLTGVDDPFEEPAKPDVVLETKGKTVEECRDELLERITGLSWKAERVPCN